MKKTGLYSIPNITRYFLQGGLYPVLTSAETPNGDTEFTFMATDPVHKRVFAYEKETKVEWILF